MKAAARMSRVPATLFLATAMPAHATVIGLLPPGMDSSEAIAINNSGLVVLFASANGGPRKTWLRAPDGNIFDPGSPVGLPSATVTAINDLGHAVAIAGGGSISTVAVRSPAGTWTLPIPSARALPTGINDDGVIVG